MQSSLIPLILYTSLQAVYSLAERAYGGIPIALTATHTVQVVRSLPSHCPLFIESQPKTSLFILQVQSTPSLRFRHVSNQQPRSCSLVSSLFLHGPSSQVSLLGMVTIQYHQTRFVCSSPHPLTCSDNFCLK